MTKLSKIFKKEGWQRCWPSFFMIIFIGFLLGLFSCGKTESKKIQIYDGPMREAENMVMQYSEKEKVTVKVVAKRVSEFQSGDRDFPEGIYIEFYDEFGNISSTLSANTAYYYKADNKWKGQGKVEVHNIKKEERLNTEELFWFPGTQKINTDKFVTIRTGKEVIYGTGLDAKQDMSEYQILKPQDSEFTLEEENQ